MLLRKCVCSGERVRLGHKSIFSIYLLKHVGNAVWTIKMVTQRVQLSPCGKCYTSEISERYHTLKSTGQHSIVAACAHQTVAKKEVCYYILCGTLLEFEQGLPGTHCVLCQYCSYSCLAIQEKLFQQCSYFHNVKRITERSLFLLNNLTPQARRGHCFTGSVWV